jgi:YVTN family beta-propeller protein
VALYSLTLTVTFLPRISSTHAGPKAYVGNFKDNTVSVIDTFSGKMVATISVATSPDGMEISQDGNAVYVAGDGSSSLNVIDTASDRVTKTIEADKQPNGIALTPDGKLPRAAVSGEDHIALVDTATTMVGTIPAPIALVQLPAHVNRPASCQLVHTVERIVSLPVRLNVTVIPALDYLPLKFGSFGTGHHHCVEFNHGKIESFTRHRPLLEHFQI